uniref:RB transcriptional corepressor like 1 n=1 Tax=Chelydra serpentina TaxID=8475 RepID=A0A8C3SBT6_CHESE
RAEGYGGRPGAADSSRAAIDRLCQDLNLDAASAAEALRDFTALQGTYSLEGEVVHWLACALYVACRKSILPTVGSGLMEGNCVSLTRILRSAKLSLIQFFSKMKKWMDMSDLPQEFRERMERLERNFEVSTVIFRKFEPIFLDVFQNPYEETPKPQRSRKQRRKCSVKELFNFCWTLFVYTKGNFRMIGDDLVNSYHLLLCCLDLIFANALSYPDSRELLNPSFKGLPADFHTAEVKASEEPPCIIATLCELHDGLMVEAKGIKEHYFKPYISNALGSLTRLTSVECKRSFAPSTPLTGRRYLREKEAVITPVASATQSVSRLQSIVAGLKNAPSEQLIAIFESCVRNPIESIMNRVKEIGEAFCQSYTQSTDDQPGSHIDFAVNRLKLAEILYFKILETIVVQETRRLHGKDMTALLEQDIFHRSLMACCLEIVLFAYSSLRTFPWIIEVLDLRPFYFYKVIEVLIRSEEGLSRDMVKHLNNIEEQILESLAWTSDSALWKALQVSENKVPTCEEVIYPSNFEAGNGGSGLGHLPMMPISPIVHPRVKEVRTDLGGSLRRDMQQLSPISVHERYSSPTAGSAKRRLFGDDSPKDMPVEKVLSEGTKLKIAPASNVAAENAQGQTVLTMATATVTGTMGQKVAIPLHGKISIHFTSLHFIMVLNAFLCPFSGVWLYYQTQCRFSLEGFFEFLVLLDNCIFHHILQVYRSVLLKNSPKEVTSENTNLTQNVEMTGAYLSLVRSTPENSSESGKEERGDLIKFYNAVYVGRVKSFALKYDVTNQDHVVEAPPLSPFPYIKQQPVSPRRISQQHSVYVSPHKNGACLTPQTSLLYKFNGSPSKSLKDINNMIKQGEHRSKKRAITIDSDSESPAKRLCQENDDVLLKRLQDVVSERANH